MWTEDQLKAIEAPVSDILVTAAAGSGKTAVMVERLISRIVADDGADIDKILVVTFTKAAASEIKERIAAKIAQKLEEGDNPRLKNQLVLINRASICTIHSYCLDVLRNNFHLLDLDPNFRVGDTAELKILRTKAMGELLDKYYDDDNEVFLRLINSFTHKRDDDIEKLVERLYDFAQDAPDPDGFLDEAIKIYSGDCQKQLDYILSNACESAGYAMGFYDKAIKLCGEDAAYEKLVNLLTEERGLLEGICVLSDRGWDRVYNYLSDYSFGRINSNKSMDKEIYEEVKKLRTKGKKSLQEIMAKDINMPLSDIRDDLLYMKPCVEMMCTLVREFSVLYTQYKQQKGIVDFNDIEHLALKLLTEPEYSEVSRGQRERFEEIYIDEYQDCNGVQEALFKAVSRECDGMPNMFMVGDMKQCIYRFRNANPQLFKGKSDTYSPYGTGDKYNKIVLSRNFRSRSQVLNCVNLIFSRIMSEKVGELNYTEDEYLYNGASYDNANDDTNYIDICIVNAGGAPADGETDEKPELIAAEAELVASKIRKLIDSGYVVYDKSADIYRPIKYRDIAILLRGIKGKGEYFADALSNYGINSFCDSGLGYFRCEEVATLISYIKVLSNPVDDVNLVSVMRSPVYNFSDEELLKIRSCSRKGSFYNAVIEYTDIGDALASKLRAFLSKTEEYRLKASLVTADELLWYVMSDVGYMEFIGSLDGGELKKANVRAFVNCAQDFSVRHGCDISGFASHIDKISLNGGESRGAKLIGENDDVVRIMTIHKSKGLEFPVVFVSQCGCSFNTMDSKSPVMMHHDMGLGINYVDEQKRFSYKPTVKNAIKDKISEENISEEMRLLYVAATRAREKLFFTGVVGNYDDFSKKVREDCEGAGERIHTVIVSGCKSYLEWICRAVYSDDEAYCTKMKEGGFIRKEVISVYDLAGGGDDSDYPEAKEIEKKSEYSPYKNEILRRLTYEYPYKELNSLPRNVTVTEIKRMGDLSDQDTYRIYRMPELKKPSFAKDKTEISTGRIGTLMHLCMEKIQLTDHINKATIKEEINSFVEKGFITAEEAQYINEDDVAGFFESEIGKAMVSAGSVLREVPFEILVEAEEIFPGVSSPEKIVVQGMIDAYFEDCDGNIVLVDYKTDRRGTNSPDEFKKLITDRYKLQVYYYEKALTLLTGRSVYKKYIYLFDTKEAIEI